MVNIKELMKNSDKTIMLSNEIEINIKSKLTIKEQQEIMGAYNDKWWAWLDSAINIAYKLVNSWNVEDDNWPLELSIENFSSLPLSFDDINKIISESGIIKVETKEKKKNIEES